MSNNNISEEIISGWRSEFEIQDNFEMHLSKRKNDNGEYSDDETYFAWIGYLAARKKAHSENEDAFKAFTLDLAERYEKEIELLKAELKTERDFLQTLKVYMLNDLNSYNADVYIQMIEDSQKNREIVL